MSNDPRHPDEEEQPEGLRILGFAPGDDDIDEDDDALPHWTQPPTGSVPAVGEDAPEEPWSPVPSSPRWRDQAGDFDEHDDIRQLADQPPPAGPDEFSFGDAAGAPPPGRGDQMEPIPIIGDEGGYDQPIPGYGDPGGGYEPTAGGYGDPQSGYGGPTQGYADYADYAGPGAPVQPGAGYDEYRQPPGAGQRPIDRNLPMAVGVGALLFGLALVVFYIGDGATAFLIAVVLGIGALEFLNTLRQVGYQPATLVGLSATVVMPLAVYWRGDVAMPLVLFLTLVVSLLWFLLGVGTERPVPNTAVTMLVVVYVGLLGSFGALMLEFPNGTGMLTAAIVCTAAYDIGGFFVGRSAGKTPLSAASPNKTVEGLIGGAVSAIAAAVIIVGFIGIAPFGNPPGGLQESIVLGLVVAVVAPIGDLCESMVKRDLGVKDMGTLLPSHGGILDRFDALLLVLPATYYTALLLDLF